MSNHDATFVPKSSSERSLGGAGQKKKIKYIMDVVPQNQDKNFFWYR